MKFVAAAILLTVCTSVSAQDEKPFDQVKQHRLSNIDKRIGHLNELKSCVSSASDKAAMKSCNEAHRSKIKALKEENKGWKEDMKAKRKERREKKN